jgi:hypothetical protein
MRGTTLFQWPMKMHHAPRHDMDCFIKKRACIFFMIDDREIIYPYLFALNFLSNVLLLLFIVL